MKTRFLIPVFGTIYRVSERVCAVFDAMLERYNYSDPLYTVAMRYGELHATFSDWYLARLRA